ncbi:hypothetical protein MNEG_0762 [Monoraphidium neglectum]|uniref:Uncharacterized protein n=1 Tax=Monoraphidium neglectum TaxID=145388 RepID=A0A0D2KA99_9CHLO|nr:hypothetical protein MNEG_0762 [Monoraphidium neglectum]KIZ07188.1 hypothetical protein MNEG_0762 [Monoraphidium neglectum]|eukprot:XP_013906207.1 hypothetical protein MNEG_0762 [Monoraphidium neglectum]
MVASPKWALVTGANRGLGFDAAKQLLASGRPVIITSRNEAAGAKAAQALSDAAAPGARVELLQLEASSPDSIKALAAQVQAKYEGQIDLLINNAGIVGDGTSPANHEAILKTNVDGAIDITLALLPHLAPGARVVQVASQMGMLGMIGPAYAASIKGAATLDDVRAAAHRFDSDDLSKGNPIAPSYSVSKAALIRATQLLAESPDFKSKDASVVAVCPGWCATDMGNGSGDKVGIKPPRTSEQGANSIVLAAGDKVPNGSFSFDGELLDWTSKPALPE